MTSWTKPPEVVFEEFSRLVGYLSAACDKIMHDGPNSFTEVARTTTTHRWVMLENMRKNMGQMPEVTSMPGYPELAEQANEVVKRLTSLLPAQAQPGEPEASQRDVVDVPAHIQRDKLEKEVREKVLEITDRIVREQTLTTLMITHNMRDALRFGNRLVMMHDGRPILDVRGEEKAKLTAVDLLNFFEKAGDGVSDKMLLSK